MVKKKIAKSISKTKRMTAIKGKKVDRVLNKFPRLKNQIANGNAASLIKVQCLICKNMSEIEVMTCADKSCLLWQFNRARSNLDIIRNSVK